MSKSEDVKTLFRRFGGSASTYQEIVSHDQVTLAEQKWPMLGQINPSAHQEAPSAQRFGAPVLSRQMQSSPPPQTQPQPHPVAVPVAMASPSLSGRFAAPEEPLAAAPGGMFAGFAAPAPAPRSSGAGAPPQASQRLSGRPLAALAKAPAPSIEGLFRRPPPVVAPAPVAAPVAPAPARAAPASARASKSAAGKSGAKSAPKSKGMEWPAQPVAAPLPPASRKRGSKAPAAAQAKPGALQSMFGRLLDDPVPVPMPTPAPAGKRVIKW